MLQFKNGKFKIMQIADVQEIPAVSPDTVKLISLALDREKPDLVIFTGDQLYGLLPFFRVGDVKQNVLRTLSAILRPLTERNVPFAVTYGNHDSQCGLPNAEQAKLYGTFPGYIGPESRAADDPGTFLLTVRSQTGENKLNILVFDSNGQLPTGEYLPVSEEQLMWFRDISEAQRKTEGAFLPTLAFQHIPVPEYYRLLTRAKRGEKGAVEAFRTHKNEFYTLPEELRAAGGFMGESPAAPDRNSGEFEALKTSGGVMALFVGHDHNNSFVGELDGILLAYTQGAGFHAYGPHRKRGVRIIEVPEADARAFTTRTVTFDDLTNDPLHAPLLEFMLTHIPTSMEQVKRIAFVGAVTVAAGLTCALARRLRKKK